MGSPSSVSNSSSTRASGAYRFLSLYCLVSGIFDSLLISSLKEVVKCVNRASSREFMDVVRWLIQGSSFYAYLILIWVTKRKVYVLRTMGPIEGMHIGLSLKRDGEVRHGSTTINFGGDNVTEIKAYLDAKGVKTEEITEIPGRVKMLMADDPDGNMLAFVESLVEGP
jgi:hypothetical protein